VRCGCGCVVKWDVIFGELSCAAAADAACATSGSAVSWGEWGVWVGMSVILCVCVCFGEA